MEAATLPGGVVLFVGVEVFVVDDDVVVLSSAVEVFPWGESVVVAPVFVLVAGTEGVAAELRGSGVVWAALVGPRGSVTNPCGV